MAKTSKKSTARKGKFAKNRKKGWKKVDISEIEKHLDEKRKDDFLGHSQKTDAELFMIQRAVNLAAKKGGSAQKFQFSQVATGPAPILKPPNKNQKAKQPIQKAKIKLRKSKLKILSKQDVNNWGLYSARKDLWNEEKKAPENEYLAEADDYFKQQTCKKVLKVPSIRYVKPSPLPAVQVPAPGASYNPAFDDHQELLKTAHEAELKKIKQEMKLDRTLTQKFPTKADAPTEETWLKEMGLGQVDKDDDEVYDGPLSLNPPTSSINRKTKAKRNKEQRHKLAQQKLEKEKLERKRMNEIFKVKSILSDIKKKEKVTQARRKNKMKWLAKKEKQAKRLAKVKYEEPAFNLLLSEELKGSLREIQPQGSVLQDRMKSLEKRNIIEPRMRRNKPKVKSKKILKKSHKEAVDLTREELNVKNRQEKEELCNTPVFC